MPVLIPAENELKKGVGVNKTTETLEVESWVWSVQSQVGKNGSIPSSVNEYQLH